jgi:glycine/D-amino acid oxidase-like deaminating enzyme
MTVDYLVVGQGLCGTFLSWNLLNEGKTVLVIDESRPYSSTKVASGVINPVTGRRIVKTWMIDEVLPFANEQYQLLGKALGAELVQQCNVLQFHSTTQMRDAFEERYAADPQYLHMADDAPLEPYFNFAYGVGEIDPCLLIHLNVMLQEWRKKLVQQNALLEERFALEHLQVKEDSVTYKDITAHKIIFCSGTDTFDLPFFRLLPYATNKGEVVTAEIPGLPKTNIYKQALSIVPWQDDLFWIGSSYEWEYDHVQPTEAFRRRVETVLNFWLKLPYKIVDHMASVRPATVERRPFVGLHPHHPAVGILNGMGTKGCSLAPYFARQLAQHLVHDTAISPEADVQRFRRVLGQVQQ